MERETATTYLTKGEGLKRAGKLKEAIATYRQAIEINPHFSWSHHKLGEALAKIGLLDEAIVSFRKAIEINPKSAWSYYELGEVFATKGEFAAAIPNYRCACELEPDFEGFSRGLEKALGKCGDRPQLSDKGRGFFEEAKTHFANRLWQETITSCRQAIEAGFEDFECYKMLGWSLKKKRLWDEAIAAYDKVIELNPTDSDGYYWLGDILRIKGKLWEAIAIYKQGLEKLPENPVLTTKLQQFLEEQKSDSQETVESCVNLGMQLVEQQKFDEAILYYEKALGWQPLVGRQFKQCLGLAIALVRAGSLEAVIEAYQKVFQQKIEHFDIYYQLVTRLANNGLIAEAVRFFREFPKPQFPQSEPIIDNNISSEYDAIWNWFNQTQPPEFNLEVDLDKLEFKAEEIQQHFQNRELKILTIPQLIPEDKILLENCGISLEYTRLIKHENNGLENIYINCFNEDLSSPKLRTQLHPQRRFNCWHVINNPVEFPHTIAEFNYMYALDPMTGEVLRSNESFFIADSLIFYRFEGREIFYIAVGNFAGEKASIYFPKFKLVIAYEIGHSNQKMYRDLAANIVTYFKDVREYLKRGDRRRNLTSLIGFVKNLGHYFWQDLNGIHYLSKNRLVENIDYFTVGPYEPLEFASVFPEIPDNKILKIKEMSEGEMFRFFLKNNSLCLRITDHYMTDDYIEKIRRVAMEKCSQEFTQQLTDIKENQKIYPLIWVNLRNHNKSWISQVKGYANIINKLRENYPNIGIVFDGWIDCQDFVKDIINRLNPEIKVYNTLGCPLHESIVWGNAIDAYIAIVGSGLVITSWLNNKPGVAYSNRRHLKQKNFWSKVKEKAIEPDFLDFDDVTDVGTSGWCNYQLDWQVIYQKMSNILASPK